MCVMSHAGLSLVMERGQSGRRYLLGHSNLTLAGFLGLLGELTGVPVPRWRVPYSVGIAVAWFSELIADHSPDEPRKPP